MLSKLMRGVSAEPMSWEEVGIPVQPGVQPMRFAPAPETTPDTTADKAVVKLQGEITALQAQVERRIREARDAGCRDGEAAGRNAAQAAVREALEKVAASARQMADLRPRLRMEAEADMVRLAIAIARRVVNRELSIDPGAVAGLVKAGLDKLRLQEASRLRVHPDHLNAVRDLVARSAGLGALEVVADAAQQRGAAVFETLRGNLDLSAETQLDEIEHGLTDRLRRQGM